MSKRTFYCLVIVLITLISCIPPPTPTPQLPSPVPATPTAILEAEEGINILVGYSESVQLKRRSWSNADYQPITFGTAIRKGDLILPPDGGEATILCADLTLFTLEQEEGSPCRVVEADLFWDGARIVNPMAPGQRVPYIIHPRNTKILNAQPLLRWQDNGASSYTVFIIEAGKAIWHQAGVTGTELRYPDDAPPLKPGVSYLLEVEDEDTGVSSSQDPIKGLGFQLLTPKEVADVTQKSNEIMALSINEVAKNFALAIYYAGQELYGDALVALEQAIKVQQSPQLLLWQGQLLLATRLNDEAQTAISAALTLADTMGDVESQAQAQSNLWQITGDKTHLESAISLYQMLGDDQSAIVLQDER